MKDHTDSIPKLLERYHQAKLLPAPAIIHKLPRLSSDVGYSVYVLRDDLTGFALGGNKTRKLDYLVGDAVAKKADALVTMKASSLSRNAAAAGIVCGLEVHVVVVGSESEQNPASQAFFEQYDTKLHYAPQEDELPDTYDKVVESLKTNGKVVYELDPGGSDSIGALGYLDAFHQIMDYSRRSGVHFSNVVLSTGSTGTQVGLVLGQCESGYDTRILGVSASQTADVQFQRIHKLASSTAQMVGIQLDGTKISVDDRFIGPGYAIPSEEGRNAVKVFASLEGILLDQVYTGKAAAGLFYYAQNSMFEGDNVLFIHTGGNSDLYY